MTVPNPRTWIAGVTAFVATTMNETRDAFNFLMGRGAGCKEYARLVVNANVTTTTGVVIAVPFNAEDWDTRGGHSVTTFPSAYTFQDGGKYRVSGQIAYAGNPTGDRCAQIRANSFNVIAAVQQKAGGSYDTYLSFAFDYQFVAGDYIEVIALQNCGGPLSLISNALGGTFMVVEWVAV